jgi:hypothetical protein
MQTTPAIVLYTVYVYYRDHKEYDRRYTIASECIDTACDQGVKAFIKGVLSNGDSWAFVSRRVSGQRPKAWSVANRAEDGSVSFRDVKPTYSARLLTYEPPLFPGLSTSGDAWRACLEKFRP